MSEAENTTAEIWKPIPYALIYDASTLGRARSHDKIVPSINGFTRVIKGRILSPLRLSKGHLSVMLTVDGKKIRRTIHQLVLETFVGPRPPGHCCCHYNGKPDDNRLSNLRWDTYAANEHDKRRHGTYYTRKGTPGNRHNALLTIDQVKQIKLLLASGVSQKDVAVCFHVSKSTINFISLGRTWKNV